MSATELVFFGAAFLIPLVGGGTLLYLLSRDDKRSDAKSDPEKKE